MQVSAEYQQLVDLDPVLTDIFYQHYDRDLGDGGVLQLFGQRNSSKSKESDLRIGSFRDPVVWEGTVEYQTVERGASITYTHTAFASGYMADRELIDDQQYEPIFVSADELGTSFARKRRKDAASVFNNAFSTSFLGYDSKALCEDDHPRSRTDSTAVDNELVLDLTSANLETAITTMQDFNDDQGEEITIMPNTLVVPRNLRKTAFEITGSPQQPHTNLNAVNVHEGINVIVDPYLTDTNAWFVVDSSMSRKYLKWYNRIMPEFAIAGDFDTMVRKYRGYMRYSYGWSDFRWIIGCNPG